MQTNNSKNVVVAILTLFILLLMVYTYSQGGAYQGGEQAKTIENIASNKPAAQQEPTQPQMQTQQNVALDTTSKEEEELKSLKDRAVVSSEVKISVAYRSKCAACHGIDGSGMQDGRALMGPKLYGQDSATILKKLQDFKDGRVENVVMKGLLINTTEEELKSFADEIGAFAAQKN